MRLAACALAALLCGCAGPAVERTVHQVEAIPRAERITVAWDLRTPKTEPLTYAMNERGMLSAPFERCTNALIDDAFRAHGYGVNVIGRPPRPYIVPGDTRYVLRLENSGVLKILTRSRGGTPLSGPGQSIGPVYAEMVAQLLSVRARRVLWTGKLVLSSDAASNAQAFRKLVDTLEQDGYLGGETGESGQQAAIHCPA